MRFPKEIIVGQENDGGTEYLLAFGSAEDADDGGYEKCAVYVLSHEVSIHRHVEVIKKAKAPAKRK